MKTCPTLKALTISLGIISFLFLPSLVLAVGEETVEENQGSSVSECIQEALETKTSRPAECDLCGPEAPLTPECATSFETYRQINYPETEWQTTIYVDPRKVVIPFVGEENASEAAYLTDYLEGTNEYYQNYGNQNTITNYQGVLRKLTPYEYQNQQKKDLIKRAQGGEIHDYDVIYTGRFCWDVPVWMDAAGWLVDEATDLTVDRIVNIIFKLLRIDADIDIKAPDIGHYCLYEDDDGLSWLIVKGNSLLSKIPIVKGLKETLGVLSRGIPGVVHFKDTLYAAEERLTTIGSDELYLPPDPHEENYQGKLEEWKNEGDGKWYRLWQAVPMLSREDSQGKITPYEGDELTIEPEEQKIEAVPHLARLYEASQKVNQILIPKGKDIEMVVSPSISETEDPPLCFKEGYFPVENGDALCCERIEGELTAVENFGDLYPGCDQDNPTLECLEMSKTVSRDIGVKLEHPYLDEIWSYTANANGGFFNIFRPYQISAFEDIPVADEIKYSASNAEVSPQEGHFYFPHLGGIQRAKEWVVNEALRPFNK